MAKRTTDVETRIEILLKLAVIPDVTIHAPRVSVENDTVTLGGIVDAFWKRSYIAGILASELPDRQIQNNLIVAMACFTDAAWKSGDDSFSGTAKVFPAGIGKKTEINIRFWENDNDRN